MNRRLVPVVVALVGLALVAGAPTGSHGPLPHSGGPVVRPVADRALDAAATQQAKASFAALPLRFEANQGQVDSEVRFVAKGGGDNLFLTGDQAVFAVPTTTDPAVTDVLRMNLVGARARPEVVGLEKMRGTSNYLVGSDRSKWQTGVANFTKVAYRDMYPGVDLVFHGANGALEYDVTVAPGADPQLVTIAFDGSRELSLDRGGNLGVTTPRASLRQHRPVAFQDIDGIRRPVTADFELRGDDRVGFRLGPYDHEHRLVVDPTIEYSTYLGGSQGDPSENAFAVAAGPNGHAFVAGTTGATNFPGTCPTCGVQGELRDRANAFVARLDTRVGGAASLVYATYLGGGYGGFQGGGAGLGIAVDQAANAYVVGKTPFNNFPVEGGFQAAPLPRPGTVSAGAGYLAKIDPAGGRLLYSTFIGNHDDTARAVTVDAQGVAYVAGVSGTTSRLPEAIKQGFQPAMGGGSDAFLLAVDTNNPGPNSLAYGTYLGGAGEELATGVDLDAPGQVLVAGATDSVDGPFHLVAGPGGNTDAFVARIDTARSGPGSLIWASRFGGSGEDNARSLAVGAAGTPAVGGATRSTDFPTTEGAFQRSGKARARVGNIQGSGDGMIATLRADGQGLVYSTYLGGLGEDDINGIGLDSRGNAVVAGFTDSLDLPVRNALQPNFNLGIALCSGPPCDDTFVAKLDLKGDAIWSSYLGGTSTDTALAVAIDPTTDDAYISGSSRSRDFPTKNAFQSQNPSAQSAILVRIRSVPPSITGLIPDRGPTTGGTPVRITGANLGGAQKVRFGDADATRLDPPNAAGTELVAISPAHAAGPVLVTVITADGTSVEPLVFTFDPPPPPPPAVASVQPPSGPTAGGTNVTIDGSNLNGATSVTFGGVPAASFQVVSDTRITAITPAHGPGLFDVIVTTPGGSANGAFTFLPPPPSVASVSPPAGPIAGGTTVTIDGANFTGTTSVSFGDTPATSFQVVSDNRLSAVTPAHDPGSVDVAVTTPQGTANGAFSYVPPPAVTGVAPGEGPTSGAQTVSISGSAFTGVTQVSFGDATLVCPSAACVANTDVLITVLTPAHAAGTVPVEVTTLYGVSAASTAARYTYKDDGGEGGSPPTTVGGGGGSPTPTTVPGGSPPPQSPPGAPAADPSGALGPGFNATPNANPGALSPGFSTAPAPAPGFSGGFSTAPAPAPGLSGGFSTAPAASPASSGGFVPTPGAAAAPTGAGAPAPAAGGSSAAAPSAASLGPPPPAANPAPGLAPPDAEELPTKEAPGYAMVASDRQPALPPLAVAAPVVLMGLACVFLRRRSDLGPRYQPGLSFADSSRSHPHQGAY